MANLLSSLLSFLRRLVGGGDASASPVSPPVEPPAPSTPVEILGIFADPNGEQPWDNLDPARWTLYVRVRGTKKGKIALGLEVATKVGGKSRVGDTRIVTFGYDESLPRVATVAMEFPPYAPYRAPGVHPVTIRVGHFNSDGQPIWTMSEEHLVTTVRA